MRADEIFLFIVHSRFKVEIVVAVRARYRLVFLFVKILAVFLVVIIVVMVMAALVIILILVELVKLIFNVRDIFVKLFEVGIELLMYTSMPPDVFRTEKKPSTC